MSCVKIIKELKRSGFKAYLVGGCVRDMILGVTPKDFDITTNALPKQVMRLFPKVIPTGIEYGTVTVMLDSEGFEVTTFRGDGTYSDGRRPDDVNFIQDIEGDLSRRDFTMNAIAFDPIECSYVDPFNGIDDIKSGVICAVGNPNDRFTEDALRILRAVRFSSRLNFRIHEDTLSAMKTNVSNLANVSPERIRDELMKTLMSINPQLDLFIDTGIFQMVIPELVELVGCGQNSYHQFDVWEHTKRTVLNIHFSHEMVRLAALFHDIGKPRVKMFDENRSEYSFIDHEKVSAEMADVIMRRLKFSNDEIDFVVNIVRNHMLLCNAGFKKPALRRAIQKIGKENLENFFQMRIADMSSKNDNEMSLKDKVDIDILQEMVEELKDSTPATMQDIAITGFEVMKTLQIKSGPRIGKILHMVMEHVIEHPEDNNNETLIELIKKF
jgi:putative nucleotidyltransferase with HDIG domain